MLHVNGGNDLIFDFTPGQDKLVVAAAEFNNVTFNGSGFPLFSNNIVHNVTNGVLSTTAGTNSQFIFDESTATLYFDTDGSGNIGPIAIATLFGMHNLPLTNGSLFSPGDFLIV